MGQLFNVRLKHVGNNRVPVLALVRPQSGVRPEAFRRLADMGDLVVARDVMRGDAMDLVEKMRELGAEAEMELSVDECTPF